MSVYVKIKFFSQTLFYLMDFFFSKFYDYLALEQQDTTRKAVIIFSTHIVSFLILFYTKCGTSLYGIGGSSLDDDFKSDIKNVEFGFESSDISKNERLANHNDNTSLCYNVNYLSCSR
jgi:hypothetical protein